MNEREMMFNEKKECKDCRLTISGGGCCAPGGP